RRDSVNSAQDTRRDGRRTARAGKKARAMVSAWRHDNGGSEIRLWTFGRGRDQDSARHSATEQRVGDRIYADIPGRPRHSGRVSQRARAIRGARDSPNVAARGGGATGRKLRHLLRTWLLRSRGLGKNSKGGARTWSAAPDACRSAHEFGGRIPGRATTRGDGRSSRASQCGRDRRT